MKKKLLNVFAALTLSIGVSAQTTVTITATGTAGSFNTGSVNSAGVKNDGDMININQTTNAGWAKFDLSTIPAGAVVMSASCAFTTYSTTSSGALNNLYGFVGDPSVIAGATLYTSCNSGTTLNNTAWTANAINTKTLNTAGINFVQTNISSNQACIGFSRASTNNYNIYGYAAVAANQPMLVITYSVPAACSGAPTAGTAAASNTLLCGSQNVNLNLTGSTSATGLTYQWQSSPNGSTWSSIATATAIATTQSVTVPTYYQCIVSCSTNTAVSTSVFVDFIGANTYASVPFLEAFDNVWQNRCDNQNVPTSSNWSSNPSTGNAAWRRQDAGATALWTSPTTATVAPIGTGCANFHSYYAPDKAKGDLDFYVNMGTASNYEMSFYYYSAGGADSLEVWLSTNAGGSFSKQGGYNVATSWTKNVITLGSVNSASCVVRFRGISDYGSNDLAFDSLKVYTAVCSTPPVAGVISGPTNVTINSVNNYTIAPTTGNLQWYTGPTATGPWTPIFSATSSTANITAAPSGTLYTTVIASNSGCLNDTANAALSITVNFPGDFVCNAIPLTIGTSTTSFFPNGATIQTGEVSPAAGTCTSNTTWCNNTLNNTMWFTFVAPASGYVTVQSPGFDTQLAIWKAANCSDLLSTSTSTLIAANDDDTAYVSHGGANFSSFARAACLTPGATYFIQLDSYSAASPTQSTTIVITDMGTALNASFTGLAPVYCTIDAATTFTAATLGGDFTVNSATTTVTQFDPASAGVGTFTINYAIFGCSTNSLTTVSVCNAITENTNASSIALYPNPNNGEVTITLHSNVNGTSLVEIFDALGKIVLSENITKTSNTINTSNLNSGIYLLKVTGNNKEVSLTKMIKN